MERDVKTLAVNKQVLETLLEAKKAIVPTLNMENPDDLRKLSLINYKIEVTETRCNKLIPKRDLIEEHKVLQL